MEIPADLGRVLVIIPTYNERDNIERITARVRKAVPAVDVLVVDDASPDGTGDLADAMAEKDDQLKVLHREGKDGLGPAYIAGFRWAAEHGYDVMVEMDADGSHQPEELPRLLAALEDADLVIGARWVPGGKVRNWPKRREALSRGANTYARLMLGIPLHDATAGYRAFRAATLAKIGLEEVDSRGYCFQIDLALRALRQGLRVVEVPITFVEREHGTSKMSRDVMAEAALRITQWGMADRVGKIRPPR
ncbi:polyprenol monophosphomannose synthase [Actinomadura bangladeshensis]|uniref:Polyprenol monophosphomannose synthase n=1 Tax=Actinomadura bangladeshensis TaxID=453573 RepID=A0A6L9QNJ5_9ACTN|nr:polyprenol monophosphomannose synthase [Actinomadura bangladeshensis]NEA27037.1 polyprenol monophosphomannose synthase [Actinomadura bangladeshensis]